MSEIIKVAITNFSPNPYQPKTRVEVSPETAERYGRSITQHGILQIPLAQPALTPPGSTETSELAEPKRKGKGGKLVITTTEK